MGPGLGCGAGAREKQAAGAGQGSWLAATAAQRLTRNETTDNQGRDNHAQNSCMQYTSRKKTEARRGATCLSVTRTTVPPSCLARRRMTNRSHFHNSGAQCITMLFRPPSCASLVRGVRCCPRVVAGLSRALWRLRVSRESLWLVASPCLPAHSTSTSHTPPHRPRRAAAVRCHGRATPCEQAEGWKEQRAERDGGEGGARGGRGGAVPACVGG